MTSYIWHDADLITTLRELDFRIFNSRTGLLVTSRMYLMIDKYFLLPSSLNKLAYVYFFIDLGNEAICKKIISDLVDI